MSTKMWPRLLVGVASAPLAVLGASRIVSIAAGQLHGGVAGTDFLNLFTGAWLLSHAPSQVYSPAGQHAFEQALTAEPGQPYLGFFLPPSSALLLAWLGWLPYGLAYLVWLLLGVACVAGAAWLLGDDRRGRLVWLGGLLLWLPILEGLGQGQTSALLLLGMAALARGLLRQSRPGWLWLALLACVLKPQLGLAPLLGLALDRRIATLARAAVALAGLTLVVVLLGGADVLASYRELSSAKMVEALSAPADFLPGPTLLHASQRFLGTTPAADVLAAALDVALLGGVLWAWRGGLLPDDRRLLQVAVLPLAAVLTAPYALVHELTCWPVAVWLLERFTRQRPAARGVLQLLAVLIWVAGDLAVIEPNLSRGADFAALLGLGVVAWAVVLISRESAVTPHSAKRLQPRPTIEAWAQPEMLMAGSPSSTSCATSS